MLPWHQSGDVTRDAFALARVADELGLVTGAPRRLLFVGLFLLPMLAALTLLFVTLRRHRWAGASACAVGALGLGCVWVGTAVDGARLLGPAATGAVAFLAIIFGLLLLSRGKVPHVGDR